MDNTLAIKTENVTYFYTSVEDDAVKDVLNSVSLEVKKGSFVAVLGHNGSGKSTLAKHLNALLLPKGGTVTAFGMDTKDESLLLEIRRRVGMVFQNPDNQIVSNVVEEDVAFAPENLGMPPEEIRKTVDEALKRVGMYEFREHAPHLLSGGQKQRIAIAGALAMKPECIVFDEPTAMLDPRGRADVLDIIMKLKDSGVTVILITHHMDEAARADRVVVMSDGSIVMDGTPKQVFTEVERLESYGLSVPDTTRLMYDLNHEGFNLPLSALTVEECADEIIKSLTQGR